MLNTYRVISLTLVMALFFAAPLLCIQPISTKIGKQQEMATKHIRNKSVKVVSRRNTHAPQIRTRNVSWVRPIPQFVQAGYELSDGGAERGSSPAVTTWEQGENWHDDYRSDWDAGEEDDGMVAVKTVSHTPLQYTVGRSLGANNNGSETKWGQH